MTIKDFKVGDEVIYLDYNGYSSDKRTALKKGYVISVGRKIITVGKLKDSSFGFRFVIDDSKLFLRTNESDIHIHDLVFKTQEDYDLYVKYKELKHWAYRFDFDRLPYDKLIKIKEIVDNDS